MKVEPAQQKKKIKFLKILISFNNNNKKFVLEWNFSYIFSLPSNHKSIKEFFGRILDSLPPPKEHENCEDPAEESKNERQ